ncbi:endonuclease/exonuclease/phosphatase family protein [Paracoccus litorisediminis]|uniref:endonuclease/exonuclease/phosphatase family protein n=1 Tax=Paracoccus litorisediminis TaxID=2006130 RepID=UPI00372E5FDE
MIASNIATRIRALPRFFTAAATAIVLMAPVAQAESFIGSWNIRHLGWGEARDFAATAKVAARYDLLAIQEVMSEGALDVLLAEVTRQSGVEWKSLLSHLVGRGDYQEQYAFLYRPDRMTWVEGAVTYTDARDVFEREPFSAIFRTPDGIEFVYASAHLIYGKDPARRQREAQALADYRDWLEATFPGRPVYIAGDFNLAPSDPAWNAQGAKAAPLIRDGATTLSSKNHQYANLYDNIWAPAGQPLPIIGSGIDRFPADVLSMSHEQARETVSDHAPVFMVLDAEARPVVLAPWRNPDKDAASGLESGARPAPHAALSAAVHGNRNSMIYHLPECPGYAKVSDKNMQGFANEDDALSAGYRKARNC